jgi:hypothetical protein
MELKMGFKREGRKQDTVCWNDFKICQMMYTFGHEIREDLQTATVRDEMHSHRSGQTWTAMLNYCLERRRRRRRRRRRINHLF